MPGGREHFDIYLAKTIYPVLVPGLEDLAREIDRLINSEGKYQASQNKFIEQIDSSIRERFNPCIFLAEFLMRNNPKYGTQLEYTDIFRKYAKIEKIRRFFSIKRQKIYKHFMLQSYHNDFTKKNIADFVKSIDNFLKMEGKLIKNLSVNEVFSSLSEDESLAFERFYDVLAKWAISQDKMSYEDFAKYEDEIAKEE